MPPRPSPDGPTISGLFLPSLCLTGHAELAYWGKHAVHWASLRPLGNSLLEAKALGKCFLLWMALLTEPAALSSSASHCSPTVQPVAKPACSHHRDALTLAANLSKAEHYVLVAGQASLSKGLAIAPASSQPDLPLADQG